MSRLILFFFISFTSLSPARAQMWNGADTLYGNEWIRYDQQYFKILVAEDGLYRIPYETLAAGGLPVGAIDGSRYQLWRLGEEQPLYVSRPGPLAPGDFIEFYGQKNRSELDRHLFRDPDEELLNPWYSLFTDTAAYFLTWVQAGEPTRRYEAVENDLTNLPAKEAWVWGESVFYFTDKAVKQYTKISTVDIYHSHYENEGFAGDYKVLNAFTVGCPAVYASGPTAELELRFLSNYNIDTSVILSHALEVRVDGNLLAEEQFSGVDLKKILFQRPAVSLGAAVNIEIKGLNNNDRYAIGGAQLRYPRLPSLGGSSFAAFALPAGSGPRYLELEGLTGSAPAVLLDRGNGQRLEMQPDGALWKAKLPAAAGERQLVAARAFNAVSALQPVSFTDYENSNADFLIVSNEQLYDDGQGNNYVQEYADYRRSEAGGGYSVAVVEARQLYDQFAYGLNRHPLSIRNFAHYAAKHWPGLRYCFIIGKGQEYHAVRTAAALAPAVAEGRMLVPSFGFPASDNLLLSDNYTSVPVVPVGRLAATSGRQVRIYLDKVQAMEANRDNPQTIADRAWMKQAIHLGGGSSANEQASIRSSLETMGSELANNAFGASVRGFYKTSTDPIQTSLSEQIFNAINEGASLITFMGHSSPGTFDFNIDNPDNYSNYAKYPLMLSLGCYSGNIFTSGESIGERFTFYENRAAVAFGASRGIGFLSSLGAFARSYYAHLGGDYYGQGIGDALRATLSEYDQNPFIGTSTLVEQFTLHGDPAIRLHPAPGPDFVVDPASVKFEPRVVTAQQDSFSLAFDALNLGRNDKDTFTIEIRRQFPSGNTVEILRDTIAAPAFRRTCAYRIPVRGKESVGLNTFFVRLDADNDVAELPLPAAELNNELKRTNGEPGAALFIVDNTARPVYPPDFALVGQAPVTLKASTTDALAPERTYILEIDTTALFDSPLKQRTAITQRGGVIKWAPTLPWQDSTAYFWRISPDSTEAAVGYTWEQSSFTYIEGSPEGWGQGGYWQFRENIFDDMEFSSVTRSLKFAPTYYNIRIKNKVFDSNDRPEFVFNGQPYASPWPWVIPAGIQLIVIDSINSDRWMPNPPGGDHGTINGNSVSDVWAFKTDTPEGREAMMNFIGDIIPYGKYVMLYSVQRTIQSDYGAWDWESDTSIFGRSIFDVLEVEGATSVRVLAERGSVPYIFMFQKGKGALSENVANNISDVIFAECNPSQRWYEGEMVSRPIGPASSWKELSINFEYSENVSEDSLNIQLIGLRDFLSTPEEIKSFDQPIGNFLNFDLSNINPEEYSYLLLRVYAYDKPGRSSPKILNWYVTYEGISELALNPSEKLIFHADSLEQGETLYIETILENLSAREVENAVVDFQVRNGRNEEVADQSVSVSLISGESKSISFSSGTENLSGSNTLFIEVNPDKSIKEYQYINNNLFKNFEVITDQRQPILDVTFDGLHILDGDLVSAAPTIEIQLKDENQYLLLSDTGRFEIRLLSPDGNGKRIYFAEDNVQFIPATSTEDNRARVIWKPVFEQDGVYQLQVQGRDHTGNASGQFSYNNRFEVVTQSTVANVLNYPNPFSTSTQFVYTLTGSVPPAEFVIRIMTVSGRVVREIRLHEEEPLRIGTHRTEFAWDGTDEYGDKLANGVYLYQVFVRDEDGEVVDKRETSIDGFFKKNIGKLVILR